MRAEPLQADAIMFIYLDKTLRFFFMLTGEVIVRLYYLFRYMTRKPVNQITEFKKNVFLSAGGAISFDVVTSTI